jgi:hypothetical protein
VPVARKLALVIENIGLILAHPDVPVHVTVMALGYLRRFGRVWIGWGRV